MTGFGSVSIAPQRSSTTTVMEFRRRRWSTRYLGLAAGFVAIGLLGAVVVTSLSGGGDDDATSELAGDEPTAALAVEQPSSDRILESSDAAVAASDAPGVAEAELAPVAEQPVAEAAQAPADEAASDSADTVVAADRPEIDPAQPLSTPAELGAYGTYLVELQQAGQLPPTPNTKCLQPGIMGSTRYLFDNVSVEVLVAVDETTRTTTAIDPDTCRELLVGPLF